MKAKVVSSLGLSLLLSRGLLDIAATAKGDTIAPGDHEVLLQVAILETNVTTMYDDLAVAPDPSYGGLILIWSGPTNSVPSGWALCDGANGTPDLRDRFVWGANGAGDVGETGGSTHHTHVSDGHAHPLRIPGHAHEVGAVDDLSSEPTGSHVHEVGTAVGSSIHVDQFGFGGEFVAANGHSHNLLSSRPGMHRHLLRIPGHATFGTDGTHDTSSAQPAVGSAENLPPYLVLAYIMKLPEKAPENVDRPGGLDFGGRVTSLVHEAEVLGLGLKTMASNSMPSGLIAMWSGITEALPSVWAACDGSAATPDLRERFVLGAAGPSDVGGLGGSPSHSHSNHAHSHRVTIPNHAHSIAEVRTSTSTDGAHAHTLGHAAGLKNTEIGSDRYERASLGNHTHTLSLAGAHSHEITLPATSTQSAETSGWTGLSASVLLSRHDLPPYQKLRFLVKRPTPAGTVKPSLAPGSADLSTRLGALEKAMDELQNAVNRGILFSAPEGAIGVWSGTLESIPAGWVLCDGAAGTPDLRGRFVAAAGEHMGGSGGSLEHSHVLAPHAHDAYLPHLHEHRSRALRTHTEADGEHSMLDYDTSHTHFFSWGVDAIPDSSVGGDQVVATDLHGHDLLDGGEHHEHDVTVEQPLSPATDSLFSTTSEEAVVCHEAEHMPPYVKLCYIMKKHGSKGVAPEIATAGSIAAGQTLAMTCMIPSLSSTLTAGTRVGRVYLSEDPEYSSHSDRVLGQITYDPALLSGATYKVSQSFEVPSVPPGDYYVIFQVDREKMVPGTTTTNILRSQAIQVRVPDLVPTMIEAPAVTDAGQTVAAWWRVANVGNAEARPAWRDRLYLSTVPRYDASVDRYLGDVIHEVPLASQQGYTAELKFTMPDVPPGAYYLILQVDRYNNVYESSETNQFRVLPIQIRVPDLLPVSLEAPAVADAGQSLTATWTVANVGNAEARPAWRDRLYLSTVPEYDASADRHLGDVMHEFPLASQQGYTAELKFTMPNVPPGAYYLILQVDRYDNVYESSETNQFRTIPIRVRVPDLRPTQLIAPAIVEVGQSAVATWTVKNFGDAAARPSWHDRVYLSTNAVYNTSVDQYLGDATRESVLEANDEYTATLKFTVPKVPVGNYYLVLRVDHYDRVYESVETNNQKALALGPESAKLVGITMATGGVRKSAQINLSPPPTTERVEVTLNGNLLGTVYGRASETGGAPSIALDQNAIRTGSNHIEALAFDAQDALTASASSLWQEWREGLTTRVRIDDPARGYTVQTDGLVAGTESVLLRAYVACFRVWTRPNPVGPGFISGEEWAPLPHGQSSVHFYVDSVLVYTSTNALADDPCYHEFSYDASGLAVGEHTVRVSLSPPEGYRSASDSTSFQVEQRRSDLELSREVARAENHFDVTVTIRNRGSRDGQVNWLREVMTGFQACCIESSLPLSQSVWSMASGTHEGQIQMAFAANALAPGATATATYKAVPILFRSDADYAFGGEDGAIEYEDARGMAVVESWRTTTATTSPWSTRRALTDAVPDAFRASDYLLVTDPVNLQLAFAPTNAATILTNMAELATVRGGVLGYYHTIGNTYTHFRQGHLVGVGHTFRDWDTKDQVFIGHLSDDRVYCFTDTSELTLRDGQLPIQLDLRPGDALAVGNVDTWDSGRSDLHLRDEIVIAWGSGHREENRGRVFSHQIDGDTNNLDHFLVREVNTVFDTGDRLAIGEVWSNPDNAPFDDIIIAHHDGEIWAYILTGPLLHFTSDYRLGDHFAVGDLLGDGVVEMVIGDISAEALKVYVGRVPTGETQPVYTREYQIAQTLEEADGLAIGDVLGDAFAEIVVADASEGRFVLYSYDAGRDRFEEKARFSLDYHADDEVACGYLSSRDKQQVLVLRGRSIEARQSGTIDIVSYFDGESPGDRWALDRLLNQDGGWATQMATNWSTEGHLLIVGETEIIPTFTKHWDIDDWETSGSVDYTDRNYASTGIDDDANTPELAVGRIVGNTAERICKALRTSIELAHEPWRLSHSRALCLSGPDEDDIDKFVDNRNSIADKLSARGFDVDEHHLPSDTTFFGNDDGRDVIFLTGHGNTTVWGSCLTQSNVFHHFDPDATRPLVYAMSCLTGRYAGGGSTLSEQFLWRGAAGYVGATEVTYGWGSHGRGWGPRFAEAFFDRLQADRTVGQSLKLAKRHRLSGAANTYTSDWNKNRYHCAVYHLYGDPKVQFQWTAGALPLAADRSRRSAASASLQGPLSECEMRVPMFTVSSQDLNDHVDIPGGELLEITGKPAVPYYTATFHFPKGTVVQAVHLKSRSEPVVVKGLRLPVVTPFANAPGSMVGAAALPAGWWPDRDFAWSQIESTDGSSELTIQTLPFFYHAATAEARFHSNCLFEIQWVTSKVDITRLSTDRHVYPATGLVRADLAVLHSGSDPIDVVAEATVLSNEDNPVAQLPSVPMPQLKTYGWAQVQWDPAQAGGGDYAIEVRLRDQAGHILDRARTEFAVGQSAGAIARFEVDPRQHDPGDDVQLSATFANTGNTSLDGDLAIIVQDLSGRVVTEFRRQIDALAAGSSLRFEPLWENASLGSGKCQFLVYADFDGKTTALSLFSEPSSAPLRWEGIAIDGAKVQLSWSGENGQTYGIDFTPDLGAVPFSCIASNLSSVMPQSVFVDEIARPKGFYRLRQESQ